MINFGWMYVIIRDMLSRSHKNLILYLTPDSQAELYAQAVEIGLQALDAEGSAHFERPGVLDQCLGVQVMPLSPSDYCPFAMQYTIIAKIADLDSPALTTLYDSGDYGYTPNGYPDTLNWLPDLDDTDGLYRLLDDPALE